MWSNKKTAEPSEYHLLHHIQLRMFCFKELDKKLQNLGMKQLMACTDLQTTQQTEILRTVI